MTDVLRKRRNLDTEKHAERTCMNMTMATYKPREKPGVDPSGSASRRNQPYQHFDLGHGPRH